MSLAELQRYGHRLRVMRPGEMAGRLGRNLAARTTRLFGGEAAPTLAGILGTLGPSLEGLLAAARQRRLPPLDTPLPADPEGWFAARWPEGHAALIAAAGRAAAGRFSLLSAGFEFDGAIDWHRDPLTGRSLPLEHWTAMPYWRPGYCPGVRQIWELNRHQHFVTLAQAWLLSQDERWSRALFGQWQAWLAANPCGRGINWTSALELGLRLVSWSRALELAKAAPGCTPGFYANLLVAVHQHAEHIRHTLSRGSSANNHLLGEYAGLISAGRHFPELKKARLWLEQGLTAFWPEFLRQVHDDGVIKEQSTGYQRYLYEYGTLAIGAAEAAGQAVPAALPERLERMAEFVAALIDEAGQVPPIGDGDDGQVLLLDPRHLASPAPEASGVPSPTPWHDLLGEAALRFDRPDFAALSAGFSPALFWQRGAAAAGHWPAPAPPPVESLRLFSTGGYAVWRQRGGGLTQQAILDAGPLGLDAMAAHGHADALNFLLTAGGQPLLIDSGTFLYRGEQRWRDYFRGTAAHNTVRIDGREQSQPLGPFQWGRRAHARFLPADSAREPGLHAEQDGYRRLGILHRRSAGWSEGTWQVSDELLGRGRRRVELFWHLAPCRWQWAAPDCLEALYPACRLQIRIAGPPSLRLEVIEGALSPPQGWFSPRFGEKKSNPVLCINTNEPLPVHIITTIRVVCADAPARGETGTHDIQDP